MTLSYNPSGDEIPLELSLDDVVDGEVWIDTAARRRAVEADYRDGVFDVVKTFEHITKHNLWVRDDEPCDAWKAFLREILDDLLAFYALSQPRTALLSLLPYQGPSESETGRMDNTGYRVFGGVR